VVMAVAASRGDLGLVPVAASTADGAWWTALEADDAPKIIARLPFVEREDHPAGLPVFGIARPHPDALVTDVEMWSIRVAGWGWRAAQALASLVETAAVPDRVSDGAALLVSIPRGVSRAQVTEALIEARASVRTEALVGSHATRYRVTADARAVPTGR
jgi:hypothetical protein